MSPSPSSTTTSTPPSTPSPNKKRRHQQTSTNYQSSHQYNHHLPPQPPSPSTANPQQSSSTAVQQEQNEKNTSQQQQQQQPPTTMTKNNKYHNKNKKIHEFTSPSSSSSINDDDDNDNDTVIDYETLSEFYKEKLISLARSHASLLAVLSCRVKIHGRGGSNDKTNIDGGGDDLEKDDGEEELFCSSQLSDDVVTNHQQQQQQQQPQLQRRQQSLSSNDELLLSRYGSLASQKSAFSDLINGCDELGRLSELEGWLIDDNNDNVANNTKNVAVGNDNCHDDDEVREKEGLLSRRLVEEGPIMTTAAATKKDRDFATTTTVAIPLTMTATATTSVPIPNPPSSSLLTVVRHVRVGVGVLVKDPRHPRKIFAGIRRGSHGAGRLALPGGHLEMNESWNDCAIREVMEEMGLVVEDVKFAHVTNDPMPEEGKHYVTIFMTAQCTDNNAIPQNMEPHKCDGWNSFHWNDLQDIYYEGRQRQRQQQQQRDGGDDQRHRRHDNVCLFGPLRRLVGEAPSAVIDFMTQ